VPSGLRRSAGGCDHRDCREYPPRDSAPTCYAPWSSAGAVAAWRATAAATAVTTCAGRGNNNRGREDIYGVHKAHYIREDDAIKGAEPQWPSSADIDLLDVLAYLAIGLAAAPRPLLRKLFDVTRLTVRLHEHGDLVSLAIELPTDQLPQIAYTAERINETIPATHKMPGQASNGVCVDATSAPGAIRTHTGGVLNPSIKRL
jgi:hypothetical protein